MSYEDVSLNNEQPARNKATRKKGARVAHRALRMCALRMIHSNEHYHLFMQS